MNERYGPLYPQMVEFKAAKQRFQEKTRSEVNKIIRGLEDRVQVARLREQDLDRNSGHAQAAGWRSQYGIGPIADAGKGCRGQPSCCLRNS